MFLTLSLLILKHPSYIIMEMASIIRNKLSKAFEPVTKWQHLPYIPLCPHPMTKERC